MILEACFEVLCRSKPTFQKDYSNFTPFNQDITFMTSCSKSPRSVNEFPSLNGTHFCRNGKQTLNMESMVLLLRCHVQE